MSSIDPFRDELLAQMQRATKRGAISIQINANELHCALGDFVSRNTETPCTDMMLKEMVSGDTLVIDIRNAAGLTIRYQLPRIALDTG